ncbi:MAG: glycine--tRNA ligase subunit beta [Rhodospirillaceae bacterium]|nr:MAG: glycine--tRNA ligase subunit beta [Rhodospirillaceae bacterium]
MGSLGGLSIDDCEQREIKGKTFYFAVIEKKGLPTTDVLTSVLEAAFDGLPWPKSMRWGKGTKRWVRPLHNILALFNGEVVNVTYANVEANGLTFGHRFLNPDAITVADFADYKTKLNDAHVMLDAADRRASILEQSEKLAADAGLSVKPDEGLLQEVTGLVEWPVVLLGNIDESFMELPPEVLTDTMKVHQKYFSLLKADGSLSANFMTVANQVATDGGKAITLGNERVLRARLSDAKFFWDQDRKSTLRSRCRKLKDIVFHAKLGSLAEKVLRMEQLAGTLADATGADKAQAQMAAHLCKCDLVTGMVTEIPEVQGVIGRYYALNDGLDLAIANAISEHYSPVGPNDVCPTAPVSVAVSLADKIDTLVGFWLIDEKPTGSKDPFALRRAALGVIRLIIENKLRIKLLDVFNKAGGETIAADLLAFFADRLKVHLKSEGVRHDLIDAVFAVGGEDDLVRLLARGEALSAFVGSDDGGNLLAAHKRAANILRIEQKKDGMTYSGTADEALFEQDEEHALFAALNGAGGEGQALAQSEKFEDAMVALAELRGPLDNFFEDVMVNVDDKKVRNNRLLLLSQILMVMGEIADFSKIEG